MKWKQFFTPAKNMDAKEARAYMQEHPEGTFILLDVRQPGEYENSHIPGAKLIPLPELTERIEELDPEKPIITYCAIGGRSRAASQLLKGKGFKEVYNLAGGIKAWEGSTAFGPVETGMTLFTGKESPQDALKLAYGMEAGLSEFYLKAAERIANSNTTEILIKLAEIEERHKLRLIGLYRDLTKSPIEKEAFEKQVDASMMEGGFTTDEFLARHRASMESVTDTLSIAMMLETQAMDLYMRYAHKSLNEDARQILLGLAEEEKTHLARLSELFQPVP